VYRREKKLNKKEFEGENEWRTKKNCFVKFVDILWR
jgi:hypothetical protein